MMFNPTTVFGAILGLATFVNAAAMPAEAAAAPVTTVDKRAWLSNIDVQAACIQQWGADWKAITEGRDCRDWKCERNGQRGGVDMTAFCKRLHGDRARAECGGGTVWDWQCHN